MNRQGLEQFREALCESVRFIDKGAGMPPDSGLEKMLEGINQLCDLALKGLAASVPEVAPLLADIPLSDADVQALMRPEALIFVPSPKHIEIGHLMVNEYGFVSAHVPDLRALSKGKTVIYKLAEPQHSPSEAK